MSDVAAATQSLPAAAWVPLAVLGFAFVAYCLIDVFRSEVRYLPKWAWVAVCLVSVPVGGIVYLLIGRNHR